MNCNLEQRMKQYEAVSKGKLMKKTPVIVRLDGKAFSTFTKGFNKPFDDIFAESMWYTAKSLCKKSQNCKIAYTQSDEISLLFIDYDDVNTDAWFDYEVQKIVSVTASITTLSFNQIFRQKVENLKNEIGNNNKYIDVLESKTDEALFDSRVFNLPKEEVNNYFTWRQNDCSRNSVQMFGRTYFSHNKLMNKNINQIQEMLFKEKGINWNDQPIWQKRGLCIIKQNYTKDNAIRHRWAEDFSIPLFSQDKNYIEQYVYL